MNQSWQNYFIAMAKLAASKSKDIHTQVGVVIVGEDNEVRATGFNGFPRGVSDSLERYANKDEKLLFMVHAEANSVAAAARVGVSLKDCTAVVTKHPCSACAALLIQASVKNIVSPHAQDGSRWEENNKLAALMCHEAGVTITHY